MLRGSADGKAQLSCLCGDMSTRPVGTGRGRGLRAAAAEAPAEEAEERDRAKTRQGRGRLRQAQGAAFFSVFAQSFFYWM